MKKRKSADYLQTLAPVTVRYTSGKTGKTISFESNGIMIAVAYEEIARLVKKCEEGEQENE